MIKATYQQSRGRSPCSGAIERRISTAKSRQSSIVPLRKAQDEQHSTYIVGRLGDVGESSRGRHCVGLDVWLDERRQDIRAERYGEGAMGWRREEKMLRLRSQTMGCWGTGTVALCGLAAARFRENPPRLRTWVVTT